MAILLVGLKLEASGFDVVSQIENHSQVGTVAWCTSNAADWATGQVELVEICFQPGVFEINNQPRRVAQRKHVVFNLALGIQHQTRVIRSWPDTNTLYLGTGLYMQGCHQQANGRQGHHCVYRKRMSFHAASLFILLSSFGR